MAELDSILSGKGAVAPEPEAIVAQPEPQAPQPEPGNDAVDQVDANDGGGQKMVPHEALHAEKQKVKRYTEQVAEFEKKLAEQNTAFERRFEQMVSLIKPQQPAQEEETPEIWADPDAYVTNKLTPLQQQIQKQKEDVSLLLAEEKHGADAVKEAYQALAAEMQSNPSSQAEYQAIMQARHPYGALVDWHKKRQAVSEIGNDPAAYREKLKAELLAEMQAQQPEPVQSATPVMPSNLAGARNVGSRSGPAWSGPQPLTDIFDRRTG